jgi:fumarate reductase subunit D
MTTGLILLVLIGVIVAFGWTRLRGKMRLGVSGKNWVGPIVVVVLLGLMLWSTHTGH